MPALQILFRQRNPVRFGPLADEGSGPAIVAARAGGDEIAHRLAPFMLHTTGSVYTLTVYQNMANSS
jgi:hypothetical protein